MRSSLKNRIEEFRKNAWDIALIGEDEEFLNQIVKAAVIANSGKSILITGETGTGKDVLAMAIHRNSQRQKIVSVECGGFQPDCFRSEMFGHTRGSFTGADKDKRGLFQEANGQTLYLDEVLSIPTDCQAALLRAVETGEFYPLGSAACKTSFPRILCSTNGDIGEAIKERIFREDLYYRISEHRIELPPLRERAKEDILLIAEHYLKAKWMKLHSQKDSFSREIEPPVLSEGMKESITSHEWPGNVRELKNAIEDWALMVYVIDDSGIPINLNHSIQAGERSVSDAIASIARIAAKREREGLTLPIRKITDEIIAATEEELGGNRRATARALGIKHPKTVIDAIRRQKGG